MNEFVEKLMERLLLESSGCKVYKLINPNKEDVAEFNVYKKCISIVKELAEEFATDTNVGRNNGWIPVEEMLPETEGKYIVCTAKGSVYCAKYHSRGRFFGTDMNTHIIAWQPLPPAYQPKVEEQA